MMDPVLEPTQVPWVKQREQECGRKFLGRLVSVFLVVVGGRMNMH